MVTCKISRVLLCQWQTLQARYSVQWQNYDDNFRSVFGWASHLWLPVSGPGLQQGGSLSAKKTVICTCGQPINYDDHWKLNTDFLFPEWIPWSNPRPQKICPTGRLQMNLLRPSCMGYCEYKHISLHFADWPCGHSVKDKVAGWLRLLRNLNSTSEIKPSNCDPTAKAITTAATVKTVEIRITVRAGGADPGTGSQPFHSRRKRVLIKPLVRLWFCSPMFQLGLF